MPVKLSTTLRKVDLIKNKDNRFLVKQYHEFMKSTGASERHQNNNLKAILSFVNYLDEEKEEPSTSNITNGSYILSFLETKKKSKEEDPDQKWISTWNHYFHRIKHFFRWYHNCGLKLLLETNENKTQIEQQFYENENQEKLLKKYLILLKSNLILKWSYLLK